MKTANGILGTLIVTAVLGCGISACGGGSETLSASTSAGAKPTGATPAGEPELGNLDSLVADLKSAGFTVAPEQAGDAQEAVEVTDGPGRARTSIAFYADPDEAAAVGREIASTFREQPGRGKVEVRGGLLLYLAEERQLTAKEMADFAAVVSIAGAEE